MPLLVAAFDLDLAAAAFFAGVAAFLAVDFLAAAALFVALFLGELFAEALEAALLAFFFTLGLRLALLVFEPAEVALACLRVPCFLVISWFVAIWNQESAPKPLWSVPLVFQESIVNQRVGGNFSQALAPLQEIELDHNRAGNRDSAHLANEFERSFHRSPGRKQIVNNQHSRAFFGRIDVDLDRVRSVFQFVRLRRRLPGQLARLANRDEALADVVRKGGAEDEPARFDAANDVVALGVDQGGQPFNRATQPFRVLQEGRDVLEKDARLGEVRYVANIRIDHFCSDCGLSSGVG